MLPLVNFNFTFFIQIVNTLILFFVLKRILFKPVTEFMDKRTQGIENAIQEAEDKKQESDRLKDEYEQKIQDIQLERNKIIEEATQKARIKTDEILEIANEEAKQIIEKAKNEIDREKQKMMNELKDEISTLALLAASKVIEKDLDSNTHEQMI
ncbi:MAG: F0F1 ATP synthase subunit B, partial [Clostridiales bacterium]|nr:F0F1 ATP synthase subunit B [Clostridiales bacterium]